MAQLASAFAWGAKGRLFESDHPDYSYLSVSTGFLVAANQTWKLMVRSDKQRMIILENIRIKGFISILKAKPFNQFLRKM